MNWSALLGLILKLLPMLAELLNELFAKAKLAGSTSGLSTQAAITRLFAALRGQTWVWEFGKRRALKLAERIATKNATAIYMAAQHGAEIPALTAAEQAEIEGL